MSVLATALLSGVFWVGQVPESASEKNEQSGNQIQEPRKSGALEPDKVVPKIRLGMAMSEVLNEFEDARREPKLVGSCMVGYVLMVKDGHFSLFFSLLDEKRTLMAATGVYVEGGTKWRVSFREDQGPVYYRYDKQRAGWVAASPARDRKGDQNGEINEALGQPDKGDAKKAAVKFTALYNAIHTEHASYLVAIGWCNNAGWKPTLCRIAETNRFGLAFKKLEGVSAQVITPFALTAKILAHPKSISVEDAHGIHQVQVNGIKAVGDGENKAEAWVESK